MPRPYIWEHQANLDKDIRIRGLGQTQREEISTKTERVEMTREEDPIIEDIIGDRMTDEETFHETWDLCQEIEVSHEIVEKEIEQKEEEQEKEIIQKIGANQTQNVKVVNVKTVKSWESSPKS